MNARPADDIETLPVPANIEVERYVLGAVLSNPKTIDEVAEIVQPPDFYSGRHQLIFRAILWLEKQGRPVDLVSLADVLTMRGRVEEAGGIAYLASLVDPMFLAHQAAHYAGRVKEYSTRRGLLRAAEEIRGIAVSDGATEEEILDRAEAAVLDLDRSDRVAGFVTIREIADESLDRLERIADRREGVTGVPCGYLGIDNLTGGFQRSDMVVLAARPAMGKTSLALSMALNAAKRGVSVGIVSLEMGRGQLWARLVSQLSRVPVRDLHVGRVHGDAWIEIANSSAELSNLPISIDETGGISPLDLRRRARRLKSKGKLDLLIVDYLQLMRVRGGKGGGRFEVVTEISQSLKELAKSLDIPVLALSQLSRAPDQRTGDDRRPQLSDLRESGSIEQDADLVLFIYRPEVYEKDEDKRKEVAGYAEVIVAKHRNGPTGTIKFFFDGARTRFEEMTHGGF